MADRRLGLEAVTAATSLKVTRQRTQKLRPVQFVLFQPTRRALLARRCEALFMEQIKDPEQEEAAEAEVRLPFTQEDARVES